jgi:hypothetical protein
MINQMCGLGYNAVCKWRKHFALGRDSLEDDENISQPGTFRNELKIQEVATVVCANHFQTVSEVAAAAAAGISHGTWLLSYDLNMSCVEEWHLLGCYTMWLL